MSKPMAKYEVSDKSAELFCQEMSLLSAFVTTGRRVGAGQEFYAALTHDEKLFRRVVEMVAGTSIDLTKQALRASVDRGVQHQDGVYTFLDPGIPLILLPLNPVVRESDLVYTTVYNRGQDWETLCDEPQMRRLRIPVKGSQKKRGLVRLEDQLRLLRPTEAVASVRVVVTFLVVHALATGKQLRLQCPVRCADLTATGASWAVEPNMHIGLAWDETGAGIAAVERY